MKKIIQLFIAAMFCLAIVNSSEAQGRRAKLPCKAKSDKTYWKASQQAVSVDASFSRDKALFNCQSRIATMIEADLNKTAEEYINRDLFEDREEIGKLFEEIIRRVVQQTITGSNPYCEKVYRKKQKTDKGKKWFYTTHMAVEVNKAAMLEKLESDIMKNRKLETMFDREKFRSIYEEEQQKFEEKRNNGN